MYHELNTRYNVYFNADEAYKSSLKSQEESRQDNLSKLMEVYPIDPDITENKTEGGSFDRSVDKTTKAIKLHSITAKPKRDPGKKKSKEYQLWLQQQEFNPFLKNAWLLLAKSQYQNKDYLLASSTFSYIMRLYKNDPEIVMEARLWLARTYLAMGWLYEAEDIFYNINLKGGVANNLEGQYAEIYADLLMRKKESEDAIPYLEKAIISASGIQKLRLKYILGQTYALIGNRDKAYRAFQDVQGFNTPYNYTFNAKIQQSAFVNVANKNKILSELNSMVKNPKNKDYLDQVYYAIGNIYLNDKDTIQAVSAYNKAIEESTRNGYDKAVVQVLLGDILFDQKKYVLAQPNYSDALANLNKRETVYERVQLRSAALEELVVYATAIQLQDSLQKIARMPELDRIQVIEKVIAEKKKKVKEEEKKELGRQNNQNIQSESNAPTTFYDPTGAEITMPSVPSANLGDDNKTSFYFYNKQLVQQGKNNFQKKWGNRKSEDNWRRSNKQSSILGGSNNNLDNKEKDSSKIDSISDRQIENKDDEYSVEYYIAQLPLTSEALAKSNEIIEDAYFHLGLIYKDQLENYQLSIEAFETDLARFPDSPNLKEIYYQLFLIYLRLEDRPKTELYRNLLLSHFPDSDYAKTLFNPNYEWNLRNIYRIQDDLYQQTYDAYLAGNVNKVRENYKSLVDQYPLSDLVPKFMYLNALTYAQTKDADALKQALSLLVEKYPKADVTEPASEMLKGLLAGRTLALDSDIARGMIWDMKFSTSLAGSDSISTEFIAKDDTEFILLFIYPSNSVNKNQLLYDIADYNFSKFIYKTFDLDFNQINGMDLIQVRGFNSFEDIVSYIDLAFDKNSLMSHIDSSIVTVPISAENYVALMNGKSLNEYFLFFEKNYAKQMSKLIYLWNKQRADLTKEESLDAEDPVEKPEVKETEDIEPEDFSRRIDRLPTKQTSVTDKNTKDEHDGIGAEDILSEETIEKADNIINKTVEIINNPIDGLKGLFNSSGSGSGLTKKEKKVLKAAKKEEQRKEKIRHKEEQARKNEEQRELDEAQRFVNDSIETQRKQAEDRIKAEERQKKEERLHEANIKREAQEQRKNELKQREKDRKERLKQQQRERKERLKQREKERKEQLKNRKKRN